jgi:peptide/nickel transport system permease protein
MTRFLIQRFWQAVLVLALMSFVIYGLMGLMPGDPIDLMISSDPNVTSDDAARLRTLYGLDKPIVERYGNWVSAALTGDFGYSRVHSRPVPEVLMPALGNTLRLLGLALFISIAISIPLGVIAAARPYSRIDYAVNLLAFAGISVPVFWLGLLLIIVFSVMLGLLPAGGTATIGETGFWDQLRHLVLPAATLIIASVGGHTRYVRSAMIEVLRADYIRTARAKGLGRWRVLLKHALRNAMIPVTTIVALDLGFLFSGALVTETIFAYPGMGKMIFDAIMGNDFNLALVALMFATLLTVIGNLLADLAYAWLDPRISFK